VFAHKSTKIIYIPNIIVVNNLIYTQKTQEIEHNYMLFIYETLLLNCKNIVNVIMCPNITNYILIPYIISNFAAV